VLTLPEGVDQPTVVELAYGADLTTAPASWPWTEYTTDVIGAVRIRRGKRPGAQRTEAARCGLTMASDDGRHHPLLATGPNYPDVRRNTPVRVVMHPDVADRAEVLVDDFDGTAVDSWGDAPNGLPWTESGSAGVADTDFQRAGGVATHEVTSAGGFRRSRLAVDLDQIDITVTVSCPDATGTGALEPGIICREAAVSSYYLLRADIAPTTQAITATIGTVGPSTSLGSAVTGLTHAAGTPLHLRAQVYDTTLRLKVWQGGDEPEAWTLTVVDDTFTAAGDAGVRTGRATGNTNTGVAAEYERIVFATMPIRFGGYVDGFRPVWPSGDSDATARVILDCQGPLRRLQSGRGSEPLHSPMYRDVMSRLNDPFRVAYWPIEEGASATQTGSPMPGVAPMTVVGEVSFGAYQSPGSESIAVLGATGSLRGVVPAYPADVETKIVNLWAIPEAGLPDLTVLLRMPCTGGTIARWDLTYGTTGGGSVIFAAFNSVGTLIDSIGFVGSSLGGLNGKHFLTSLEMERVGSDVGALLLIQLIDVTDPQPSALFTDTFTGQTFGRVTELVYAPNTGCAGVAVGHAGLANDRGGLAALGDAIVGHAGESATARVTRLLAEEGIPGTVVEGLAGSAIMGPQPVATLTTILQEVEDTDFGVLDEMPFGVRYVANSARYNQTPALELDTAVGSVKLPFDPAYDDRDLVNDAEARRDDGSTARTEATGDLAPSGSTGRYEASRRVNTFDDEPLDQIAAWLAHIGTVDEYRIPALVWDLVTHPDLIDSWLAANVTSRITAAHQLTQYPPEAIDQLLDGYVETFDAGPVWTVEGNGSPARPYDVFVVEDAERGRLDTGGSTIAVAVDENSTTLRLATSVGPEWTTDAAYPADFADDSFVVMIGGEAFVVTGLSTDTPNYIGAGTVAHGNNAPVAPGMPAGMTPDVGQVVLGVAAIRNSGAGVPDLPDGFRNLALFGNIRFFGAYYTSDMIAPTVTFTGGAANATTSAALVGWSGLSLELDDGDYRTSKASPQTQLNGSAQNIAWPALSVRRSGCVSFIAAWKADDWSGAAGPGVMDAELVDSVSTLGDDQGIAWYTKLAAPDLAADSLVITGGASAISRAITLALRPLQTATVQRALNGVSKSHAAGSAVLLYRPGQIAL
jgi:hypothetical protein